jgi:alpha-tubulin suppressor-like RCC1 family protein
MSYNLWRCLLEDDVDTFRQYLANATFASGAPRASSSGLVGGASFKIGSPGNLSGSPKTPLKSRKSSGHNPTSAASGKNAGLLLTRSEVNTRDTFGRSILQHAASSRSEDALVFIKALLEIPFIDLYAQDLESGWTALHRALYFGNISVAHALMVRDFQDATDYTTNTQRSNAGGLVKIKDHEGNSPFEVFGLTIAPRTLQRDSVALSSGLEDDDSVNGMDYNEDGQDHERLKRHSHPSIDLAGDEVYAFGSNKNLSLGVGDGDDRHFPERLQFTRPDHLLRRLLDDHLAARQKNNEDLANSIGDIRAQGDLPAIIRHRPITIQNVVMSKLHTAVLTKDPISNLYMCGFGPGGRLGTGDENTTFTYQCIQAGGLARRHIIAIALGQDHSVAVCSQGGVFTWGSNRYGQLGYALPDVPKNEIPIQLVPRQLYGYIKKELIIGAAASAIHTALYTSSALYTFGKNEGQLGLVDADARSLQVQVLPRRVGPSVLQSPIQSVSAIDRATIVLLESHEVVVFTHYGWTKVVFPLETFTNYYMSDNLPTRYHNEANYINQITSGGSTICAMSSFGEVYSIEVPKVSENVPSHMSTTNPTKARNALPQPTRLWSIRKAHMSAIDVAVGQDGSILLCTASGSVWRKEKRANVSTVREMHTGSARRKDYKFVRIPNLTGAIAVRSNAFGAFTAVRKDCTVTREQIVPSDPSLWKDLLPLLPFASLGKTGTGSDSETDPARIGRSLITSSTSETDMLDLCKRFEPLSQSQYNLWVTSNLTEVRIPIHSFMLTARSRVLRHALSAFQETYYFSIPDVLSMEYGPDGHIQLSFQGADFLTIVNLVFYLYTENVVDVWHYTSKALSSAARYRSVRIELMKIAASLELQHLERAVRTMVDPSRHLMDDMEYAVLDANFFSDADVTIELANAVELPAHSVLLCRRCPFFDGLFNGRAGGVWVASRRNAGEEEFDVVKVDLQHIDERIFNMVLRHIYADTGEDLFDDVVTKSLDEFIDLVIEVMSAANELMLDRLAQICQQTLGKYVNVRNVCSLLNTVAECAVDNFKRAALEYICLNLESMLEMKLIDELDEDLFPELDEVVQANQLAFLPFARSDLAEEDLLESHPELLGQIESGRQRRIDSMRLRSRLVEDEERHAAAARFRIGSLERQSSSPLTKGHLPTPAAVSPASTPGPSPAIVAHDAGDDLPFDMDDDSPSLLPGPAKQLPESSNVRSPSLRGNAVPPSASRPSDAGSFPSGRSLHLDFAEPSPAGSQRPPVSTNATVSAVPIKGFESGKAAWQFPARSSRSTDLKDIMAQASAGQVSNLTQAMQTGSTPSKTNMKMSQKERKRQQQLLREQEGTSQQSPETTASAGKAASSPWQTPAKSPKPDGPSTPSTQPRRSDAARPPPKQNMTMRQTVAGLSVPSKPAAPQAQSIRHIPIASRAVSAIDAHTSMAEILAQQQTEKIAVQEAVAKRSLQEIQQEQEFQEWWDNEARRVQEEHAQASSTPAAAPPRRGKGPRGRGGPRRGSGKERAMSTTEDGRNGVSPVSPTTTTRDHPGHGTGRPRGSGRGRGQGTTQQRGAGH